MNLLSIETSSECCSVALSVGGRVSVRHALGVKRHAELILPFVDDLLSSSGIHKRELNAIVFGQGPGAFTGVRLAVSVAQGLSFALDIPALGVSTLASIAQAQLDHDPSLESVLACIDARMGEVYVGHYKRNAAGLAELVGLEAICNPSALQDHVCQHVAGSGAVFYTALFMPRTCVDQAPSAQALAKLASAQWQASIVQPGRIAMPVYLRDKVAQTRAERAAGLS